MDNTENQNQYPGAIDIPGIFHSDLTGKPIEKCVNCDKNMIESNEPYIIEKAFRYYREFEVTNTIFEYIMCVPCAMEMHASMSEISRQKIQEHMKNIDMHGRSFEMKKNHGNDFNAWIDECIVLKTPRQNLEEYQICAQCIGNKLIFDVLPYMMSHEASDEITSLLSAETLEEYNRFVDDNFGLPPEFKKALKDSPVFVT